MTYRQLTQEERYLIYAFCKAGFSITEIANEMGRHKSTISREIKRNKGMRGYRPKQAEELSTQRRRTAYKAIKWTNSVEDRIEVLLRKRWSPEQISKRLVKNAEAQISHQRIYEFVQEDKIRGGDLYTYLRQGKKKRRKKYGKSGSKRGQIINRVSISERPEYINNRQEYGHWEGDTIIGKNHKRAMITLVERKSGFTIIKKVASRKSEIVSAQIISVMGKYKSKVKSITFDNGLEFADHEIISKSLKCDIYFADPYSSWQRGTSENTNGLIRQYFPKGSDFDMYSDEDILTTMNCLNDRPRKRLDFYTPNETPLRKRCCT